MFSENTSNDCSLIEFLENNVSKACIPTLPETILNRKENFENNVGKWCILVVFKTN
mgnify:CR=1 FL=1